MKERSEPALRQDFPGVTDALAAYPCCYGIDG